MSFNYGGVTEDFINNKTYKDTFFKPYTSFSDLGGRAATILTAPFYFGGLFLLGLVATAVELFKSVFELCRGHITGFKSDALHHAGEMVNYALGTAMCFVLAACSPIVNLIDFCGSAVTYFTQSANPEVDEEGYSNPEYDETVEPDFFPAFNSL